MAKTNKVTAEFPEKLGFLFQPKRYKIAYGGRGGSKSWGFARALLILASMKQLRVLCCREIQKSIKDSVHKLLKDQIAALGLDYFFNIQETSIKGANGSDFSFIGLRHNSSNIKSYEAVDVAWVEEAVNVSKSSWEILIPTIRKDNSEIWVSFNPELEDDETYQRFVLRPPDNSSVVKIGYQDNPWFPPVLEAERLELKRKDQDAYLNVWEGHCREVLEGAIYANELRAAKEENRIAKVNYDASVPVHTFWDLGWADNTSIWFAQAVGMEYRVIDFYQSQFQPISHYLKVLQDKPYVYGKHWLPHDARAKQLGTGRSIEEIMTESLGLNKVEIVAQLSVQDGINAARSIFGVCWFDQDKCADGLSSLRRYKYYFDQDTGKFSKTPEHDEASHAADAFRYMALSLRREPTRKSQQIYQEQSWASL